MAKIDLSTLTSGYNLTKINENFQKIEDALNDEVLYRDNPSEEINTLESDLDLNNKRLLNLPDPVSSSEPVRLQDLEVYSTTLEQIVSDGEETVQNLVDEAEGYAEDASGSASEAESWAEVAKSVAGDESVVVVESVEALSTISVVEEGRSLLITGYQANSKVGGGRFIVETTRHDGGTAISLTRSFPTDWTDDIQVEAWFLDSGSDELCAVRLSEDKEGLDVFDFGADATGTISSDLAFAKWNEVINDNLLPGVVGEGVLNISTLLSADTPITFKGVFKCGYDSATTGLRLENQPIHFLNYLHQYCDGDISQIYSSNGGSGDMNTAALTEFFRQLMSSRVYFTGSGNGRRAIINSTVYIDADDVPSAASGDSEQRNFITDFKFAASNDLSGTDSPLIEFISTLGTNRSEYIAFTNCSFDLRGRANGVRCANAYNQLIFNTCFFRQPERYQMEFDAPAGESGSDLQIIGCQLTGNSGGEAGLTGLIYNGSDLHISGSTIIRYHETNIDIIGGSQNIITGGTHLYGGGGGEVTTARRTPNIRVTDGRSLVVTGCYIDNQPIVIKSTGSTVGDAIITDNFFVLGTQGLEDYSYVEVEVEDTDVKIQRLVVCNNRFISNGETVTRPFRSRGAGTIDTTGSDDNTIEGNSFLFVQAQSTRQQRVATFAGDTQVTVTIPVDTAPFRLVYKQETNLVNRCQSNPGSVWLTSNGDNSWYVNTENAVTGTISMQASCNSNGAVY